MKKIILMILMTLLLCNMSYAGQVKTDSTFSTTDISDLITDVLDTLVILGYDTVSVDETFYVSGDTTCLLIYIREFGVLTLNGVAVRLNVGGLYMGGCNSYVQPFTYGDPLYARGGEFYMDSADTLELFADNLLTTKWPNDSELYVYGADAVFEAIGTADSMAVIMRGNSNAKVFGASTGSGMSATVYMDYVIVQGFIGEHHFVLNGDVTSRNATNTTIDNCKFDTTTIEIRGHGIKMSNNEMYNYEGTGEGNYQVEMGHTTGDNSACSLYNWTWVYDGNGSNNTSPAPIYVDCDSLVVDGCNMNTIDRSANGIDCIIFASSTKNRFTVQNSIMDGGYHTIDKVSPLYHGEVLNNVFIGPNKGADDGEALLWRMTIYDTTLAVEGNLFWGYSAGAMLLEYSDADTFRCDLNLNYNTMLELGIVFRCKTAGDCVQKGGTIFGNISVGDTYLYSNGGTMHMYVGLDDFKYYSGDSVEVSASCDPCSIWIWGEGYNIYSEGTIDMNNDSFGFPDSSGHDYTNPTEVQGDGETTVCESIYGETVTVPCDLGYDQDYDSAMRRSPFYLIE